MNPNFLAHFAGRQGHKAKDNIAKMGMLFTKRHYRPLPAPLPPSARPLEMETQARYIVHDLVVRKEQIMPSLLSVLLDPCSRPAGLNLEAGMGGALGLCSVTQDPALPTGPLTYPGVYWLYPYDLLP
jgi:hypothetical protein